MILLCEKDGHDTILIEERSHTLSRQPGDFCLPGGAVEDGESPCEAALRECEEELLISKSAIQVLGALDAVIGARGETVWPFVGRIEGYNGTFSTDETERILYVNVEELLAEPDIYTLASPTVPPEDFPYELIRGGRAYPFGTGKRNVAFYQTKDAVIWGLTANILHKFMSALKNDLE